MPIKYGEFKHPSSFGFSGSAGKTMVRGYARGGHVKKAAKGGCACGGKVHKAEGGLSQADRELVQQVVDHASKTGRLPGVPTYHGDPLIK